MVLPQGTLVDILSPVDQPRSKWIWWSGFVIPYIGISSPTEKKKLVAKGLERFIKDGSSLNESEKRAVGKRKTLNPRTGEWEDRIAVMSISSRRILYANVSNIRETQEVKP